MADIKYESKIGQIVANDAAVYAVLSNLENINRFRDAIPQDKIQELEISSDRIRFKVEGLGQKIAIVILDKEEYKTIKFGAENLPIPINVWIQIIQTCVYFVDSPCFSGLFETNRPDSDSIRSALRHPGRKTDRSFWNNLKSAFLHWQLENLSLWNSNHNTGSRNSGRCNAYCWQAILLCNACKYP